MALLAPHFLDSVVAIGFPNSENEIEWAATGFFYGRLIGQEKEGVKTYRPFLVTNGHVLEGKAVAKLRFNPKPEGPARDFDAPLVGANNQSLVHTHPDPAIDVAVLQVNAQVIRDEGIELHFFQDDIHVADIAKCNELGVSEGDGVYALGFPLGLVGEERNYAIARQGSIARIRDALAGSSREFLIDTFIFPGNSGGPVVIRPEITAIKGTKPVNATFLIGIVIGYVPYQDVAFSRQTGRPRVSFEENSGLASIHPIDFVKEVIDPLVPLDEKVEGELEGDATVPDSHG